MEKKPSLSRRGFLKAAGFFLAASACTRRREENSASGMNIPKLKPDATETPLPVELSPVEGSSEEVVEIAEPKKTPTPETPRYPLPEGQINPNFSIGPISLERAFRLIVPHETSKLAGYGNYLSYDVNPLVVFEDSPPKNLIKVFNDYVNHPTAAFVVRSEIPFHNLICGHSFSNFTKPLLLDWTRRVYQNSKELIGKPVFIEQNLSGKTVKVKLEFVHATHVDDRLFNEAGGYYEDDNEPMFIRTDILGLPNDARKEQQVTFIACLETLPGQERTSSRRYTDNRVVLTAELREVIEE